MQAARDLRLSQATAPSPATGRPNKGIGEQAQVLSPPPSGLSARRVERWLDLPPGAWQRRRLYALRIRGSHFEELGLLDDDLVVVEPGGRQKPGSLVATRGPLGSSLKRAAAPVLVHDRMPTVLELPLRERTLGRGEHVIGTVIGVLRATGTGALKAVPFSPAARPQRKRRRSPAAARRPSASSAAQPCSLDHLLEIRKVWRGWLALHREAESGRAVDKARIDSQSRPSGEPGSESRKERWQRLDSSLSTLCDCLLRTQSPALRAALAAEAGAVVSAIEAQMRG